MFEVIISVVSTGRVERRVFETRDEADRFADEQLEQVSNRRRRDGRPCGSAGASASRCSRGSRR